MNTVTEKVIFHACAQKPPMIRTRFCIYRLQVRCMGAHPFITLQGGDSC